MGNLYFWPIDPLFYAPAALIGAPSGHFMIDAVEDIHFVDGPGGPEEDIPVAVGGQALDDDARWKRFQNITNGFNVFFLGQHAQTPLFVIPPHRCSLQGKEGVDFYALDR